MYISFSHPSYLIFLFGIPILIFIHFYALRNIKGNSLKFANFESIARVKGIDLYSKNISGLVFNIALFVIIVLALSGLSLHKEVSASSFSFVIAIDSSASMTAKDISPDRFSAAKETAINFVNSLPYESYVGIISFSGDSKIVQELTRNKDQLKNSIENMEIGQVQGTDINEAIVNSVKLLKGSNNAIILISDGQINIGDMDSVIEYTKEKNVIVHTLGVGSVSGGEAVFGMSKLDEDSLKSLAYSTGGKYFSIDSREKMESSFSEIISVTKKLGSVELYPYLIMLFIIFFILKEFLVSINRIGF